MAKKVGTTTALATIKDIDHALFPTSPVPVPIYKASSEGNGTGQYPV